MEFFLLVLLILILWLHSRHSRRLRALEGGPAERLNLLERQVAGLKRQLEAQGRATDSPEPGETATEDAADSIIASGNPLAAAMPRSAPLTSRKPVAGPAGAAAPQPWTIRGAGLGALRPSVPPAPRLIDERWARLQRQLVENWTGILGSVVLVAGITFIGGYTGLRLSPFYRTLVVIGAAALLGAGGVLLDRRSLWQLLAQWLKSSGAAVFLFACFAASSVPGLSWITTLNTAVMVLLAGVAVNLLVAYRAGSEPFASLHIVLALIPLALIPQSPLTLVLATLVAAAGLGLSFKARWEIHTLVTLTAFIGYQALWFTRVFEPAPSVEGRVLGIVTTLLVGLLAALTHYRPAYAGERLKALPWITHLGSWVLLGAGIALYHVGNTPFRGVALIVAGAAVFLLARWGRQLGIRWLFLTDSLVGQVLATVGVVSFYPFVTNWLLIPLLVLTQTALFLRVVLDSKEPFLERVAVGLVHLAALSLGFCGLIAWQGDPVTPGQSAGLLLAGAVLAALLHLFLASRRGEAFDSSELYGTPPAGHPVSLLGVLAGLLAISGVVSLDHTMWMFVVTGVVAVVLVILANRAQSSGLSVGISLLLIAGHLWSWSALVDRHPVPPGEQVQWHFAPLVLCTLACIALAPRSRGGDALRRVAVYCLGAGLSVAGFTLLEPMSSLAPSVAWLTLSLLTLESAGHSKAPCTGPLLHLGYLNLLLFGGAYTLVVLQAESYLGPIPVRLAIEAYGLGVGAYWWRYRPSPSLEGVRSWRFIQPLFLELSLLFLTVILSVELAAQDRPVAWVLLAIGVSSRRFGQALDARFRFYSLLFFWASIVDLVAVTGDSAVPSGIWWQQPGLTGTVTIVLQVIYLALRSPDLQFEQLEFPGPLSGLAGWARRIAARQAVWLYSPFFIGVALFLYWRFSAALLTLLWVAETFVVFGLSLVLRESHFRYMALAGLGACMIRLILFDMAEANLGVRGLVFVGVGALMLGMHSLYNRYKSRFA